MRWRRLDRRFIALVAFLVAVCLANAWYGLDTWRAREDISHLEDDLATEKQALRRLQSIGQLSRAQQELIDLQAKAPPSLRQPLPTSVDTLKVISDLISGQSGKITEFKAKEPRIDTVDGNSVQVLGYELGFQGNAQEMLTLLQRVDESSLVSLKIRGFTVGRLEDAWTMKLDLTISLLPPVQPTSTPVAGNTR